MQRLQLHQALLTSSVVISVAWLAVGASLWTQRVLLQVSHVVGASLWNVAQANIRISADSERGVLEPLALRESRSRVVGRVNACDAQNHDMLQLGVNRLAARSATSPHTFLNCQ
jgi:hypothetical protein